MSHHVGLPLEEGGLKERATAREGRMARSGCSSAHARRLETKGGSQAPHDGTVNKQGNIRGGSLRELSLWERATELERLKPFGGN